MHVGEQVKSIITLVETKEAESKQKKKQVNKAKLLELVGLKGGDMKKIFIETLSLFNDKPEESELSKDYWSEYGLSLNEIVGYNESTAGYTTVDLINGNRHTIAIKFDDFKSFMKVHNEIVTLINPKALYEFKDQ